MGMEADKQEFISKRKIAFRLCRSYPFIIGGGIIGMIIALIIYFIVCVLIPGDPDYTADFTMYLDFADGKLEDNQYYNGYTWDQIASSDKILGYTISLLPDSYTREEVNAAVTVEILADVRVLTGTVITPSEIKTNEIAEATIKSFEHFTEEVDAFDTISLWQYEAGRQLPRELKYIQVSIVGVISGIFIALAIIWLKLLTEDTICTTEECRSRLQLPAVGIYDSHGKMYQPAEVKANINLMLNDLEPMSETNVIELATVPLKTTFDFKYKVFLYNTLSEQDYAVLRASNHNILAINWGNTKGSYILHALDQCTTQNVKISGVIICNADTKFLKYYY